MAEVAQLLRHADQATSSIYAAADITAVAALARPCQRSADEHPAARGPEYLDLRRSFGYVLAGQDRPLADFAGYLERIGARR